VVILVVVVVVLPFLLLDKITKESSKRTFRNSNEQVPATGARAALALASVPCAKTLATAIALVL
jgi:hypothetical protein